MPHPLATGVVVPHTAAWRRGGWRHNRACACYLPAVPGSLLLACQDVSKPTPFMHFLRQAHDIARPAQHTVWLWRGAAGAGRPRRAPAAQARRCRAPGARKPHSLVSIMASARLSYKDFQPAGWMCIRICTVAAQTVKLALSLRSGSHGPTGCRGAGSSGRSRTAIQAPQRQRRRARRADVPAPARSRCRAAAAPGRGCCGPRSPGQGRALRGAGAPHRAGRIRCGRSGAARGRRGPGARGVPGRQR